MAYRPLFAGKSTYRALCLLLPPVQLLIHFLVCFSSKQSRHSCAKLLRGPSYVLCVTFLFGTISLQFLPQMPSGQESANVDGNAIDTVSTRLLTLNY